MIIRESKVMLGECYGWLKGWVPHNGEAPLHQSPKDDSKGGGVLGIMILYWAVQVLAELYVSWNKKYILTKNIFETKYSWNKKICSYDENCY